MARMQIVPGPDWNNWGATLPIRLVPETTSDASFEERAFEWVQLHYPASGFATHEGRSWPIPATPGSRARHIAPDILTHVCGLEDVVLVADAKNHMRLARREVDKVIRYRAH